MDNGGATASEVLRLGTVVQNNLARSRNDHATIMSPNYFMVMKKGSTQNYQKENLAEAT